MKTPTELKDELLKGCDKLFENHRLVTLRCGFDYSTCIQRLKGVIK